METNFKGTKKEWTYHIGETIGVSTKKPILIIADVEIDKDIPKQEQKANAKLIAAAPDLLKALIQLRDETSLKYKGFNKTEAQLIAEKAIKKAIQ